MWALRAAVRPGVCLSRVVRGCRALRVASLLPPWPQRALAAFGPGDPGGLQERGGGGRGPRADGRRSRAGEEEDEEPEGAEQEEEDVEELLRREPLLPAGAQRVCLVHPEVKWGPGQPLQTRGDSRRCLGGGAPGAGPHRARSLGAELGANPHGAGGIGAGLRSLTLGRGCGGRGSRRLGAAPRGAVFL